MRCRYCNEKLSLLKSLSGPPFCSKEHEKRFEETQSNSAFERLLEFVEKDSKPSAGPLKPAATHPHQPSEPAPPVEPSPVAVTAREPLPAPVASAPSETFPGDPAVAGFFAEAIVSSPAMVASARPTPESLVPILTPAPPVFPTLQAGVAPREELTVTASSGPGVSVPTEEPKSSQPVPVASPVPLAGEWAPPPPATWARIPGVEAKGPEVPSALAGVGSVRPRGSTLELPSGTHPATVRRRVSRAASLANVASPNGVQWIPKRQMNLSLLTMSYRAQMPKLAPRAAFQDRTLPGSAALRVVPYLRAAQRGSPAFPVEFLAGSLLSADLRAPNPLEARRRLEISRSVATREIVTQPQTEGAPKPYRLSAALLAEPACMLPWPRRPLPRQVSSTEALACQLQQKEYAWQDPQLALPSRRMFPIRLSQELPLEGESGKAPKKPAYARVAAETGWQSGLRGDQRSAQRFAPPRPSPPRPSSLVALPPRGSRVDGTERLVFGNKLPEIGSQVLSGDAPLLAMSLHRSDPDERLMLLPGATNAHLSVAFASSGTTIRTPLMPMRAQGRIAAMRPSLAALRPQPASILVLPRSLGKQVHEFPSPHSYETPSYRPIAILLDSTSQNRDDGFRAGSALPRRNGPALPRPLGNKDFHYEENALESR